MVEIDTLTLNPNPLVRALGKQPHEFTRHDIIRFVAEQDIPMLNLRYLGGDGRLKVLNFAIQSSAHLNRILTMGERVDGSSLFNFVDATSSDLYVVPQLRTAFLNPFAEFPTLDIVCGFYDVEGNPLASSPQQILRKAQQALEDETGCRLEALGELEYYLFSPAEDLFPVEPQRGYHEASPFSKCEQVRIESLAHLVRMGCSVKYAHSEVGNFVADGLQMVQQEIEFLPTDVTRAADEMTLAKWVVRKVAHAHGIEVSFSPKIVVGQAGSGMHFHTRLMRDGVNQFSQGAGLTDVARRVVGGYLSHAASLTAFGNPVPTSFLRLVPHQEAPTAICWGDRNRSALVRVPLGWQHLDDRMFRDANPQEEAIGALPNDSQTVELRSPDGAANVHLLLAGITVAARIGLSDPSMLDYAMARYVNGDASGLSGLDQLPASCAEAARRLLDQRGDYEALGVFPPGLIDAWAGQLIALEDENLRADIVADRVRMEDLVERYFHIG
ncbi:glutamine synthetase family protein [Arachnia rubra]|uniref:glutamine synthetase n=1 Tax=Arachnia rubra TaxID=1547448 RepID=A0ABX7Y3G7_9ACTN|nr:glutamine synthetase family protein [Arachnia rubra]MDO4645820.1 glutamine synthetase family protein [Propionibacteriaceae bacterium]QUC07719.1 glutamine synthetase [Arachnia rubra]BCR82035.1 glutamine synthetase [Arachnia rubra]